MSEILEKICKTIEKHNMLEQGGSVLVALSGGADSVCLLKALSMLKEKYDLKLYAAHLNHMLRGADAEADEKFAEKICAELCVPFYSKKTDVAKYAEENSLTSEEAGRILRYDFFAELSQKYNIQKIATAHNSNDNTETVLMRFIRGTGYVGLAGIPYVNNNIIRPLLDISRDEIEAFLFEQNTAFVTDKTNLEPVYFRNKIRLGLIPEIEEKYNPNFKTTLSQNICGYKNVADYLNKVTNEKASKLIHYEKRYSYINLNELHKEHDFIISSVIHKALETMSEDKEITFRAVSDIVKLASNAGGALEFSKELYIFAIYGRLFFIKQRKTEPFSYNLSRLDDIYIKECEKTVVFRLLEKKDKKIGCIYLDYSKIQGKTLTIRSRKDGDFFFPSGLKGKKKLKDFFIDKKIPFFLRDEIPVFLADGEIICVGNLRESEKYKVTKETEKILEIYYGG